MDARPDFAQLNSALAAVDEAIAKAASGRDLAALAEQVRHVSELQQAELSGLCRFVWDGGRAVGPDQRILWDAQPTNHSPTNLAWSRGSAEIQIAAAGLYELKFGIFAPSSVGSFRAQLLLNDEIVAQAVGPPAHPVGFLGGISAYGSADGAGGASVLVGAESFERAALGSSSEAAAQSVRSRSVKRRGKHGGGGTPRATITTPRPLAQPPALELAALLSAPVRDGPRLSGPTCVTLVCALPNSRLSLAVGPGVPVSVLNGFLEVRKVFN